MQTSPLSKQHYHQLYIAFCAGDPKASTELVTAFSTRVFNYMRRVFSDEQAHDYVQSTWLKLLEHCGNRLKHDNMGAWIMLIAKNIMRDDYRKQHRLKRSATEQYETEMADSIHNEKLDPFYLMQQIDQQQAYDKKMTDFTQALAQLPLKQRQALHLQQSGHRINVIAELTGEKKETVRSQLRHGKNKLKAIVSAEVSTEVSADDVE